MVLGLKQAEYPIFLCILNNIVVFPDSTRTKVTEQTRDDKHHDFFKIKTIGLF